MIGKKLKAAFFLIIITSFILGAYSSVLAKDPEFRLNIDSLNLQKGSSTTMVLSLINVKNAEIKEIKGLDNFEVLSKNQTSSSQDINGDKSYKIDIHFTIMPKNVGQFTLQGIVECNGNTYQTNSLTVNVSETQEALQNLFIKTNISSTDIYLGQKVVLSYELYSRYSIDTENSMFKDKIEINGFMMNDVPNDKLKVEYPYLEGKRYAKYELKQTYLAPIKAGTFTIPEYNFQVGVITDGGIFGFSQTQVEYLKTEAKQLTVKALPGNQPSDFSGIVGKLNLKSEFSRQEVPYGDSLTLKVAASGNCDLSLLDKITKNGVPGFTVYETGKDIQESIVDNQYSAQKEYEIILVPEKSGEVKIDPIYISYFDTESGTYKQAEIPGTTITVTGEAPQIQTQAQNSGTAITEKVTIDQINYAPKNDGYLTIQLKKDYVFVALSVLIILALLAVLAFFILRYFKKQDRKLLEMYKHLKGTNDKNEIYNVLNDMIKYCFNLSLKASSRDTIKTRLAQYELSDQVLEIIDYIENDKNNSHKADTYLKDKIKEVYKVLNKLLSNSKTKHES
ncbi:BatD family protein [Acetivibrio cellulolyticus]|uniref:BatD family protein n=1 Tax=Acetivibrio cellulolyticus TaxID=35830 RepID=UPI0001E2F5B5|nr:BatD family protein [Acetivibrio cellulolyticus]